MNIIDRIVSANYIATATNIESLAREHANASGTVDRGSSTYLHVLIAMVQQRADGRRMRKRKQGVAELDLLEEIHGELYPHVLKGVGHDSDSQQETNRRATFARTAKSTLASYLKAGKSVADLIPGETTKRQLREAIAPPQEAPEDRMERIVTNARDTILRAIRREAKEDVEAAREDLELLIEALSAELEELAQEKEPDHKVVSHQLTRTRRPHAQAEAH